MKRLILWLIILGICGGGITLAVPRVQKYLEEKNRPKFRYKEVTEGNIIFEVQATGTIQPVLKVHIGSFVSGPIAELHAEFNQKVKKGDLLARVDPRLYEAAKLRDEAAVATAEADVERAKAVLNRARNDERRAKDLAAINPDYISQTEMDEFRFNRQSLEAQLLIAEQSAKQARARLRDSALNLEYTEIRSPDNGIIINRMIDPGQTLAAQFQAPELFELAVDVD
ncbi:MAG: biotin/lipoyl-binding protein, partial [Planctomycetales bacterium]|nr:biotin/lipoyl-binding protein [Planctomycetales bacterium]